MNPIIVMQMIAKNTPPWRTLAGKTKATLPIVEFAILRITWILRFFFSYTTSTMLSLSDFLKIALRSSAVCPLDPSR